MSQTWTLKKGTAAGTGNAIIAKFSEPTPIPFEHPPSTLYMYRHEEEIVEKDAPEPGEKAPFVRERRRRRSSRAKTTIRLEEIARGDPVLDFERVNMEGNIVDSNVDGLSSTKYVLLDVVKKNGSVDPNDLTINVILVGDTYHFKKIVASRVEKSLEELDNEYDKQIRLQKEANKKYHRIYLGRGADEEGGDDEEKVSNPFGSSSSSRRRSAGGIKKENGNSFKGHMDDGGLDIDEERNFDEMNGLGGEYEGQKSDDEDDAEQLQGLDLEREENNVDGGDIFEDDDLDSDSSSEANDEEEDELTTKDKILVQASSEISDFLSKAAALAAANAANGLTIEKGMIVVNHDVPSRTSLTSVPASSPPPSGSRVKRPLDEVDDTNKRQKVSSLTEDLVRETMVRMGGRVPAKTLANELKKPIRKMGDEGRDRFKEILLKISQTEVDAVFGKVLVLKK